MKQRRYTKTIFFLLVLGLSIKLEAQTISKTVTIIHGGLSSAINDTDKKTIKSLVINGTIDVRDFVTIRDSMPAISELDLRGTTIAEYTETVNGNANTYQANTIPSFAFFNLTTNYSKDSLTTFIFPKSVTKIGSHAFQHCSGLHSLLISSEITSIDFFAFGGCSALLSVDPQNTYYSSSSGILFNKDQTTLIQVPTSITGYYSIPQTTTKIGEFAFAGCDKVLSVYIPSSVISIGDYAFTMRTIKAITASSSSPIDFVSTSNAPFNGIDYNYCTLYVPQGSVTKYKSALKWGNFVYIKEMTAINLSNTSVNLTSENSSSTIDVTADTVTWQAVSSQTWLTISSDSTTKGDGKITIKVFANPTTATRTALVIVSAIGVPSQTIVVTQDAGFATIKDVSNNNQVLYPNPTRGSFVIDLIETAKIEVYSVSNQLVLCTTISNKEPVSLKDVSPGIYFVKIITDNTVTTKILIVE